MNLAVDLELNPHDREIVNLLREGCSNDEIAAGVGLNVITVKRRLHAIYLRAGILDGSKRVRLIGMLSNAQKRELPALSPIERCVADMVITGLTNPEIAERIETSEQLIKNYLRVIFDKCGVWSRTELAARFRCA